MGEGRAIVMRGPPAPSAVALAAFAAVILMAMPFHEALAQAEIPPPVQPSADPGLDQHLDRAFEAEPAPARPHRAAILQGLNKTTARVSTIEAPIGVVARFGTLEITARACKKKPPTEPPESTAFLEIVDVRPDSPSVAIFTGWMFASSPAISALEHPVYDVWVIDCAQIGGGDSAQLPPSQDGAGPAGQESEIPQ